MVSDAENHGHHNGRLWRAMQSMKRQPQGESIYALLDETTKARIAVSDLWIEVCYYVASISMKH